MTTIWEIAKVTPTRELKIESEIKCGLGLKACVPYERKYRKARGKQGKPILIPYRHVIIPGYVLVGSPSGAPWYDIKTIQYVKGPVQFDGVVGRLTDAEVDRFRKMAEEVSVTTARAIRPGDQARVINGPFANFESMIHEIKGADVRITVSMFQGDMDVWMPAANIEKAA